VKFFGGGGLTIFLYFLAHALVLKLPPDILARIPFEVDPVVHVLWLIGLVPMLSGLGHIIAGLTIKREPLREVEFPEQSPLRIEPVAETAQYQPAEAPPSVTERTTNILERDPTRRTNEEF
jgi:hypothetical protein